MDDITRPPAIAYSTAALEVLGVSPEDVQRLANGKPPLLVTDGLVFPDNIFQDNAATEAAEDGAVFEYGPDTPELRQRNSAILAGHLEQRRERWREIKTKSDATDNRRLAGYAANAVEGILKDVEAVQNGPYWNPTIYLKAGQLAGWAELEFGYDKESDGKAALLAASAPWNNTEEKRARTAIDNGWARPIPPKIPTEILENRRGIPADGKAQTNGQPTEFDPPKPITLAAAHKEFKKWLGDDYDTDALDAILAAAAVEKFDDGSDPLWLLLVSGSGNAKTETVQSLKGVGAQIVSAISSDAALLSGTPRRERSKTATGGLLRKVEPRGVLVIKDVTSILSMDRNLRAKVLAALREVYDGEWVRDIGSDGGQHMKWAGRIAIVGAVTTAWDTAHSVIATMGDRFALVRMDSTQHRKAAGRMAIGNTGKEPTMRAALAGAVEGVIAGMTSKLPTVTDAETETLLRAADLVTRARTAVEYDYRGDVIDAHAPEMPTRFAKQLGQVLRGGVAIGMTRKAALRLAIRVARDSMPPLRLAIVTDVVENPDSTPSDVRRRINKPWTTVDRQLHALHMLGIVTVEEVSYGHPPKAHWQYTLSNDIDPTVLDPAKR